MIAFILMLTGTLFQEIATSLGKSDVEHHRENIYSLLFLVNFGLFAISAIAIFVFGGDFKVNPDTIPFLLAGIFAHIVMSFVLTEAIIKSDRTAHTFVTSITIPLLLIVDISLGYKISALQAAGVLILFLGIFIAFSRPKKKSHISYYSLVGALLGVVGASLNKHILMNDNSVMAFQLLCSIPVILIFFIISVRTGDSPIKLLVNPRTGSQSFLGGISSLLEGYAFLYAPASIVISLKRACILGWSILSGKFIFHESSMRSKTIGGAIMAAGIFLMVRTQVG